MTKKADISSKRLIGIAPTPWACWLTGDATGEAGDLLANELQFIGRATDVVIKVRSPHFGDYLIANEIQFRVDPEMPRRMRAYAGLVEERHRLPVYPVVINIMEAAAQSPSEYRTAFMGFEAGVLQLRDTSEATQIVNGQWSIVNGQCASGGWRG